MNFFPSKYPIVEAIMNGASDLRLALAVADAGAFPSLFYSGLKEDVDELDASLTEFNKCIGNCNLILPIGITPRGVDNLDLLKVIRKHQVSHIELFRTDNNTGRILNVDEIMTPKLESSLKLLKQKSKLLIRLYSDGPETNVVDGYCIKGTDSAGRTGNQSVKELFELKVKSGEKKVLLPYGGVGTPEQVSYYLSHGAPAVAVGTLFAASLESPLDEKVKSKMVAATSKDLVKTSEHRQNQLVLGSEYEVPDDDWNRSRQLKINISSPGDRGFVYAGKAIDHITDIRPVKDIVEYLVSGLMN